MYSTFPQPFLSLPRHTSIPSLSLTTLLSWLVFPQTSQQKVEYFGTSTTALPFTVTECYNCCFIKVQRCFIFIGDMLGHKNKRISSFNEFICNGSLTVDRGTGLQTKRPLFGYLPSSFVSTAFSFSYIHCSQSGSEMLTSELETFLCFEISSAFKKL